MIIVECWNDQALIYRMGFTPKQVAHEYGKSRVIGRVENRQGKTIGIIDEDPKANQPPDIKRYEMQTLYKGALRLFKGKGNEAKRLAQISPYFEDWLCKVAKRNRISLEDFGLPEDPAILHQISFRKNSEAQRFLIELIKAKDEEIITLREWIKDSIE